MGSLLARESHGSSRIQARMPLIHPISIGLDFGSIWSSTKTEIGSFAVESNVLQTQYLLGRQRHQADHDSIHLRPGVAAVRTWSELHVQAKRYSERIQGTESWETDLAPEL